MPFFGLSSSPFDKLVEKATDEANVSEDWQQILECCDYINNPESKPVDCLKSILKRMLHNHPNVSIQSVILLDACVNNCGKRFHSVVASRDFEHEARKLLSKGHPQVVEKFKLVLRKWSENEFKSDPELNSIIAFVNTLKAEGHAFPSLNPPKIELPKDPNIVISDQEEEDIIKALEASMKDLKTNKPFTSNHKHESSNLFPEVAKTNAKTNSDTNDKTSSNTSSSSSNQVSSSKTKAFKVQALYDFEDAEDNELAFKAGDIITVTDSRDENWWFGSTQMGEGMFPSNFVTKELNLPVEYTSGRNVQFDDNIKVKMLEEVNKIDEEKIDRLLHLIHEADPTGVTPDSDELIMLEDQCCKMGKLIDNELERLDRIQVALNTANRQLTEAMKLYLQCPSELA